MSQPYLAKQGPTNAHRQHHSHPGHIYQPMQPPHHGTQAYAPPPSPGYVPQQYQSTANQPAPPAAQIYHAPPNGHIYQPPANAYYSGAPASGQFATAPAQNPLPTSTSYLTPTTSAPNHYNTSPNLHNAAHPSYSASTSPGHLTPAVSAPTYQVSAQNYGAPYQSGTVSPLRAPASPNLHPTNGTPHRIAAQIPDMSRLSLNSVDPRKGKYIEHWATCDGCNADPIKGERWRCLVCNDYDLCDACRSANIHNHHRFENIPVASETHTNVCCDGCKGKDGNRLLVGPRYKCQTHKDEDWCQRCMVAGKACSGPFDVNAQSELGWEIERNHMLPMPDQWLPYLKPAIAVYNVDRSGKSFTMWYDWPDTMKWYDTTYRERRKKPIDPKYTITSELKKSKLSRDAKQTWTMCDQSDKKLYTYFERIDGKTGQSSEKTMTAYKGASTTPTFKQDNTSNSLSFTDPASGMFYRWISNRPISTINGERFDFQRNALFRTHNGAEVLVADFSWYDGHLECEDALTIRDPSVSHALVIASLTLLHGHHWAIMHDEFRRDPDAVNKAHECARLTEIGKKQYFKESEDGGQVLSGKKGKSGVDWKAVNQTVNGVNGVLDGVNSIVAADGGGGGGGDGGGGGGGGDGGGGGGVC